ncbi:hypothetical protein F4678DRAFT_420225 [Xylaria arbuscula]|nr:hypothetical protein F4678DRAFT_420225 [Xylaria arbuscula]
MGSSNLAHALVILRSLWKRPRGQQALNTYFLQLPVELILCIADFLTPPDLILLSQTCHPLRTIFWKHTDITKLSRTERLSYLAGLAREQPKKWICQKCMTLHRMAKLDTPAAEFSQSSCPRQQIGEIRFDIRLWYGQIKLEHRHIQLALKYTRLRQHKYDKYLRAVMTPYLDTHFDPRSKARVKIEYAAYPKIATACNAELKFLLLSTWRCYTRKKKISFNDIGDLPICPHVTIEPWYPWRPSDPGYGLQQAIHGALEGRGDGKEHTGSCPRCTTDFSVKLESRWLDLHVWQDFGSESSPGDIAWEVHCDRLSLNGTPNLWDIGLTLEHEPGTIRKLYEKNGRCASQSQRG